MGEREVHKFIRFTWNREVTLADAVSIFMSGTVFLSLLVGGAWAVAEFKSEQSNTKERLVVVEGKVEENTDKIDSVETTVLMKIDENTIAQNAAREARRIEAQKQRQHIIDMVQQVQTVLMRERRE